MGDSVPHSQVPFQVPAGARRFVGRQELLTGLCAQLMAVPPPRVVALTGMGGIGKTTLAVQAARLLRSAFPDGVLWADATTRDPRAIAINWGSALGYDFSSLGDAHSAALALRSVLATRRMLLVLDDVDSASSVQSLLPDGTTVTVLITTRSEEAVATLGALPLPVHELAESESLDLLAQLAGPARIAAEATAARTMCRLVEGLPLAVEIVGRSLAADEHGSLDSLLTRLSSAQQRLGLHLGDRAVRTSFAVSWEALDTAQCTAFVCLAVFEGRSFTAEALAHVMGSALFAAQERLDTLVARSLLSALSGGRYRQHALLADFARELLGEARGEWQRMAAYYAQLVLRYRDQPAALSLEGDNMMAGLRAAQRYALSRLVITYVDGLGDGWFAGGRYAEAREGYGYMRAAARKLADMEAEARCLLRWGEACLEQDDRAACEPVLISALALYEQMEDDLGLADAHFLLARMAIEHADYAEAEAHLAFCRQVYARLGDGHRLARTLHLEALVAYDAGRWTQAEALCDEALQRQLDAQHTATQVPILRLLADIAIEQGEYARATGYCQQALALCEHLDNRSELAAVYYSLAVVARCRKALDEALAHAQKAAELLEHMGVKGFYAVALFEQSKIAFASGDLAHARELALASQQTWLALDDSFSLAYALHHLGVIMQEQGDQAQAQIYWHMAANVIGDRPHPIASVLQTLLA